MTDATESDDVAERPSKSQRKRDMVALQDIGTELVMLNADQLAQMDLPERLFDAIVDAQRIHDFEGRRRQMQYIGKLMREIDPAPIRARLDMWSGAARDSTAQQKLIERWRERLLAEDTALTLFAAEYAGCDMQHLRSLIASVKRDRALNRTPKNYRGLFRAIRDIVARRESQPDEE
ncbi:MAG: ribosome biogenesis factor YjgA [Burkholderiales bacterium]